MHNLSALILRYIVLWAACGLLDTVARGQDSMPQAAAHEPYPLWDPSKPVPKASEIPLLKGVQFHVVKRRQAEVDGYNWLHGAAVVRHDGVFYASFGHNCGSENTATEVAHGRASSDQGRTWGPLSTIDAGGEELAVSHGVFLC